MKYYEHLQLYITLHWTIKLLIQNNYKNSIQSEMQKLKNNHIS